MAASLHGPSRKISPFKLAMSVVAAALCFWVAFTMGGKFLHQVGILQAGRDVPKLSEDASILFREYAEYLEFEKHYGEGNPALGNAVGTGVYNLERREPYRSLLQDKIIVPLDLITVEFFLDVSKTCVNKNWPARRCAVAARELSRYRDSQLAEDKEKERQRKEPQRQADELQKAEQAKRKNLGY